MSIHGYKHRGKHTMQVRVLGGLPLTCEFSMQPAEPDVGLMHDGIDEIFLVDRNGRPAEWAERRMTSTDWAALEEKAMDYVREMGERGGYDG